jgi:hypothetical protein
VLAVFGDVFPVAVAAALAGTGIKVSTVVNVPANPGETESAITPNKTKQRIFIKMPSINPRKKARTYFPLSE